MDISNLTSDREVNQYLDLEPDSLIPVCDYVRKRLEILEDTHAELRIRIINVLRAAMGDSRAIEELNPELEAIPEPDCEAAYERKEGDEIEETHDYLELVQRLLAGEHFFNVADMKKLSRGSGSIKMRNALMQKVMKVGVGQMNEIMENEDHSYREGEKHWPHHLGKFLTIIKEARSRINLRQQQPDSENPAKSKYVEIYTDEVHILDRQVRNTMKAFVEHHLELIEANSQKEEGDIWGDYSQLLDFIEKIKNHQAEIKKLYPNEPDLDFSAEVKQLEALKPVLYRNHALRLLARVRKINKSDEPLRIALAFFSEAMAADKLEDRLQDDDLPAIDQACAAIILAERNGVDNLSSGRVRMEAFLAKHKKEPKLEDYLKDRRKEHLLKDEMAEKIAALTST